MLSTRRDRVSDLARQNLERVAASAAQLQAVLLKDPGILVELKRWVAKEATDNGQLVEDSELSDQAIFNRLDHDVQFRSVTTQLVQRYGYLLPDLNPDSDIAKEHDLVLKERARRMVQLEDREDSEPPSSRQTEGSKQSPEARTERTSCDPQSRNCDLPNARRRPAGNQSQEQYVSPAPPGPDEPRQTPSSDQMRSLRMASVRDESIPGYASSDPNLSLAADVSRRPSNAPGGSPFSTGSGLSGVDDVDSLLRQHSSDEFSGLEGRNGLDEAWASNREANRTVGIRSEDRRGLEDTRLD
ncbi:MAG: hypothetical protein ACRD4E_12220, partial [Bryobacteraceae bacterium]